MSSLSEIDPVLWARISGVEQPEGAELTDRYGIRWRYISGIWTALDADSLDPTQNGTSGAFAIQADYGTQIPTTVDATVDLPFGFLNTVTRDIGGVAHITSRHSADALAWDSVGSYIVTLGVEVATFDPAQTHYRFGFLSSESGTWFANHNLLGDVPLLYSTDFDSGNGRQTAVVHVTEADLGDSVASVLSVKLGGHDGAFD